MQLISKIISSGGLSYTTLLKVKVTALIYCISSAGTAPNYELVLSKLGNNFEGSSKPLLHQYHQKYTRWQKQQLPTFWLIQPNSAATLQNCPCPLCICMSFTISTSHSDFPMCSFRTTMGWKALRDAPFISFDLKRQP